jgi:hypothetical protein
LDEDEKEKPGKKGAKKSSRKQKPGAAWLKESNDGDIVDFLDTSASKKVLGKFCFSVCCCVHGGIIEKERARTPLQKYNHRFCNLHNNPDNNYYYYYYYYHILRCPYHIRHRTIGGHIKPLKHNNY